MKVEVKQGIGKEDRNNKRVAMMKYFSEDRSRLATKKTK